MNFSGQGADQIVLLFDDVAVRLKPLTYARETPRSDRDDHVLRRLTVIERRLKGLVNARPRGSGRLDGDKKQAGYGNRQNLTKGGEHASLRSNTSAIRS